MPNRPVFNTAWARALWLVALVAASVGFSLGFACAVPLAAFGAVAATTLSRRDALLLLGGVWLANQVVGFGWLHYPHTAGTFTWGGIFLVVAIACVIVPAGVVRRLPASAGAVMVGLASFSAAFVAYEGGLFLVSATIMGGTAAFASAIVARIFAINLAACAALFALDYTVRRRPSRLQGAVRAA